MTTDRGALFARLEREHLLFAVNKTCAVMWYLSVSIMDNVVKGKRLSCMEYISLEPTVAALLISCHVQMLPECRRPIVIDHTCARPT